MAIAIVLAPLWVDATSGFEQEGVTSLPLLGEPFEIRIPLDVESWMKGHHQGVEVGSDCDAREGVGNSCFRYSAPMAIDPVEE
jgi:hypothetical protein